MKDGTCSVVMGEGAHALPSSRARDWMTCAVAADKRAAADSAPGDDDGDVSSPPRSMQKERLLTAARSCCLSTTAALDAAAAASCSPPVSPSKQISGCKADRTPPLKLTISFSSLILT